MLDFLKLSSVKCFFISVVAPLEEIVQIPETPAFEEQGAVSKNLATSQCGQGDASTIESTDDNLLSQSSCESGADKPGKILFRK